MPTLTRTFSAQRSFNGIAERGIAGYCGIELLRRQDQDLTEFVTIMWFDSFEAVRVFAGEDYEVAVVPPKARTLLKQFDGRSAHYEVRHRRPSQSASS